MRKRVWVCVQYCGALIQSSVYYAKLKRIRILPVTLLTALGRVRRGSPAANVTNGVVVRR